MLSAVERDELQTTEVLDLVRGALKADLVGVYPHGSATLGGPGPRSDLDLLALTTRSTDEKQRHALVEGLLDCSGRRARLRSGRPVELIVVVHQNVVPWHYPPVCDFLYGEWLRDDYEAGFVPQAHEQPDLAILLTMARASGSSVVGPPPAEVLPAVPEANVRAAGEHGIPALMADLSDDTANVLLTLARVWHTAATGRIVRKDRAADWVRERLDDASRRAVQRARAIYLGEQEDIWDDLAGAQDCAARIIDEITRVS